MKTYSCIIIPLIALLLPLSIHANTFCVSDATGLQTALTTASGNGEDDTVQIEQGTYVGSFICASTEAFSLTVEGGYTSSCSSRVVDSANTVLDANETGSVLVFSTPDTIANLEVDGLTLQNGVAGNENGGGIYADTLGDVIISNNTIIENTSNFQGGGVYSDSDSGTITLINNTITGNNSNYGGGVKADSNGTITLANNTIIGNSSDSAGGGVYAYYGTITLINNTITGNNSNSECGGLCAGSSNGTITLANNTITGNTGDYGGGVQVSSVSGTINIITNTIKGNEAARSGGGVYIHTSSNGTFTLTNNTITGNLAGSGGGVYASSYSGTITLGNNTITGNTASDKGGGIRIVLYDNNPVAVLTNNIIWNNTATSSENDLFIENDGNDDYIPSIVNLYNNDFDQSADGTYIQIPFTIDPSNLDNEDPLFVDAPIGDYHLTDLSPCIDAGRLEGAPADDMDGHTRPQGSGVDIGADEYIPPDADEDGIPNEQDNCPTDANPDQSDTDHDCIGDVCDDFPTEYDPTVPDSDGDGVGNACDVCPYDLNDDIDADGLCANDDNCPDIPNGPNLGSCINILTGVVGTTCLNDGECGTGETCSNNQEDRNNNGAGDACDIGTFCRGLADYDQDVDANDVTVFLSHFGRSQFNNPCPIDGPTPVPKTGQTTSYATGDDGALQRGVSLVTPRFTDNGDGTVTDNQTGLIWLKEANCISVNYPSYDNDDIVGDGRVNWQHALDFVAGINNGTYLDCGAGSTKWRLPNSNEVANLVHKGYYSPAVPNTAGTGQWSEGDPFTNVQTLYYWSSTTNAFNTDYAWRVYMALGDVNSDLKSHDNYVWPVRGGH